MKMGMLGSKGGALVGVLGRVAAVGAVAFIGWEIGTILRDVLNLDEGMQKLLATLSGKDITDRTQKDFDKLRDIYKQIRKDIRNVTKEQMEFFVLEKRKMWEGTTPKFVEYMKRQGIKPEYVLPFLPEEKGIRTGIIAQPTTTHAEDYERYLENQEKSVKIAEEKATGIIGAVARIETYRSSTGRPTGFQTGTARVPKTGLAIVHEGEEIKPKAMAGGGGATTVVHMGGVTINLKSAGSAQMDAYQIKRELDRLYNMEARRLP